LWVLVQFQDAAGWFPGAIVCATDGEELAVFTDGDARDGYGVS
jgi:hypothetical protein